MALSTDRAGNVVGVDPHKRTLSATVVDERGGIVATAHYKCRATATALWRRGHSASAR